MNHTQMPFSTALAAALALLLVLSACDSTAADDPSADCESRTGNSLSATVGGEAFCSDLGGASIQRLGDGSVLNLSVIKESGQGIFLIVWNPAVGSFDLTAEGNFASYGHDPGDPGGDDEVSYAASELEGSGTLTLTALSDERVEGTFAFVGVGQNDDGTPTGDNLEVTDGVFDYALTDVGDFFSQAPGR